MALEAKSVEQKLQVLTHQNQRLAVQLEEKRKATKALQDKVAAYEQKEQDYERTLLCVNRVWGQFTAAIAHLCTSLAGHADLRPPPTPSAFGGVRDPILQRLVSDAASAKPVLDAQKRIDAQLSEVEQALQERARTTKDALAAVLDAVRAIHARQDDLAAQLRAAAPAGAAPADGEPVPEQQQAQALLAAENERLCAEAASLRREADGLRAASASAAEQLRLSEDRRLQGEQRIQQLQNELADAEQELSNVHKKYLALKNAAGASGGAGGGAPAAAGTPGGVASASVGSDGGAAPVAATTGGGAAGAAATTGPPTAAPGAGAGGAAAAGATPSAAGAAAAGGADGGGPSRQGSLAMALPPGSAPAGGAANGPPVDAADYADELSEAQALLAKRTGELEKEREAHLKTRRELGEAQARVGDEGWVPSTRTYALAQQQAGALHEALAARARDMEALARERDEALREAAAKASMQAAEQAARAKLASLERSYRELQFAKADADRARGEAEAAAARERARCGSAKTAAELSGMVAGLQAQVAALQKRPQMDKMWQERLDAASRQVVEAGGRAAAAEAEAGRLRDALARREAEAEEGRRREGALREAVADLRAFVDVLTAYCDDPRDGVEVRAAEAALRAQVAELRGQLEGHPLSAALKDLAAAEKEARAQLELSGVEAAELRLQVAAAQRQAGEAAAQLAHSRSECELYTQEIEAMAAAYEELQSQNGRLAAALVERDEAAHALVAERLKLSQALPVAQEAADAARAEAERLGRELEAAGGVREALERDLARTAGELAQVKEALRGQAGRLEALAAEVRRRDEAVAAMGAQLDGAARQLELKRLALEEADAKHVKEKSKRQRAEEETKALQGKLERLRKLQSPAGAARELQEEADAMRQLLNCNVCHERQKNRIITKCCHVFCDVCIDRTLTARNRKCPGCGVVFAKGDVKSFFFT